MLFRQVILKICEIICAVDEWHGYIVHFDSFADKEMAPVDVFRALVVLGVVGEIYRRLVVHRERRWFVECKPEVVEEGAKTVHRFFCSF
eukprot:6174409-Pleurochrysis_carterae.AAC.1